MNRFSGWVSGHGVGMETKKRQQAKDITAAKTIMEQEPSTSTPHLTQQLDVSAAAGYKASVAPTYHQ